ncbi:hypothetical protein FRB99_004249 [Tulasnella sp. 403]|nr:hypothetical protein FRB99_004249 [Tulasnella sp. 403]
MPRNPPALRKDPSGTCYQNEAGMLHFSVMGSFPSLIVVILPDSRANKIYCQVKKEVDNPPYWVNVCLKYTFRLCDISAGTKVDSQFHRINVKLGGINIVPKAESIQILIDPSNLTLILGADVVHPVLGLYGCPSFASVVGSIDSTSSKYIACTRLQLSHQEMIEELEEMVHYMIVMYTRYAGIIENRTQRTPKRIIFYHSGISDSQF